MCSGIDYFRCEVWQRKTFGCRPWTAWQVNVKTVRAGGTQSAPTWQVSDAGERTKITWCQSIQNLVNQDRDFVLNKFRNTEPV